MIVPARDAYPLDDELHPVPVINVTPAASLSTRKAAQRAQRRIEQTEQLARGAIQRLMTLADETHARAAELEVQAAARPPISNEEHRAVLEQMLDNVLTDAANILGLTGQDFQRTLAALGELPLDDPYGVEELEDRQEMVSQAAIAAHAKSWANCSLPELRLRKLYHPDGTPKQSSHSMGEMLLGTRSQHEPGLLARLKLVPPR